MHLSHTDFKSYVDSIIAQGENFEKNIIEIIVYSDGAILPQDAYLMSLKQLDKFKDMIIDKKKNESGKRQEML